MFSAYDWLTANHLNCLFIGGIVDIVEQKSSLQVAISIASSSI